MNAEEIFLNAGLRPTKARLAVLKIITEANSALSHPEILEQLSEQKEFDRVTVYRVLDWLTDHQLIHRISGDNRAWKFQLSQSRFVVVSTKTHLGMIAQNHHHAHLHCKTCGQVTCILDMEPHFSRSELEKYHVDSMDINIKGICLQCSSLTHS